MSDEFFRKPILNSPYEYPARHWELDSSGQPTQKIADFRRKAAFVTPIPKPKKNRKANKTGDMLEETLGLGDTQKYDPISIINEVRRHVDAWRRIPNPNDWLVTPETARLLQHWRNYPFTSIRPFFCQVEAVEVAIWLTEVAPKMGKTGKKFLDYLEAVNLDANPALSRLALKLATGAGKTTVMAMLIAWQTINAVRQPNSKKFTRGFLLVAPGLTIKDRLRVLMPNDPESYYQSRELVPSDLLPDLQRAKIVITNYHAFKLRERMEISKGGRALLKGRTGDEIETLETEGQMIQRVMPELMGFKNIMVINDEAHHCYREKPPEEDDDTLKGDEKNEAEENNEAARLWISGLEIIKRNLGINQVVDLSATPFFLKGSGYAEGTLFHWTMSDFSLMDAIECGIVKLPRVPVADNLIKRDEMPMFRNLWEHIRDDMPKKGRGKGGELNPADLPPVLLTAIDALYGHYEQTFALWQKAGIDVPPCFIIVCNNTAASKLVYDLISGYSFQKEDGSEHFENGRLALFRNFDEHGNPYVRPRTLLIDSHQLESGDALDDNFRKMAALEIEKFKEDIRERTGDIHAAEKITDQELLREVMNTVGKKGKLGESIRCVVSVSMLTEGWDANTVTHVLGVRAFGTQLLCEQVIGRALRRQSYELNEESLFNVEYADVLGIPFDFTAKPVVAPPQRPREVVQIKAVKPERNHLEITFPRVVGYRIELENERLEAEFTDDSVMTLTPDLIGATETQNAGIIGETANLNLKHMEDRRASEVIYKLTTYILQNKWRDGNGDMRLHLFGQLKRIVRQWLENYLECKGGTYPAHLEYKYLADMAAEHILAGINRAGLKKVGNKHIKAMLDGFNPYGSSTHVNFNTSKAERWDTSGPPPKCHINYVVYDSEWEAEFCRVAEAHPKVKAYVKNHGLGFEVPYRMGSYSKQYRPDFIVKVDDGNGDDDLLNLIVEIKGYRGEDAKIKKTTMETYWVSGVNNLGTCGRWAFVEFSDAYEMQVDFAKKIAEEFNKTIEVVIKPSIQGA